MEIVSVISHNKININNFKDNACLLHFLALDYDTIETIINTIDIYNIDNYKEIIIQIAGNSKKFILLHGFPGDSPVGCILLDDSTFVEIGENYTNYNNDLSIINNWYNDITKEYCDYSDIFWY